MRHFGALINEFNIGSTIHYLDSNTTDYIHFVTKSAAGGISYVCYGEQASLVAEYCYQSTAAVKLVAGVKTLTISKLLLNRVIPVLLSYCHFIKIWEKICTSPSTWQLLSVLTPGDISAMEHIPLHVEGVSIASVFLAKENSQFYIGVAVSTFPYRLFQLHGESGSEVIVRYVLTNNNSCDMILDALVKY